MVALCSKFRFYCAISSFYNSPFIDKVVENNVKINRIYYRDILVCDLNRTTVVMAKHGGPCVHLVRNLHLRENLAR